MSCLYVNLFICWVNTREDRDEFLWWSLPRRTVEICLNRDFCVWTVQWVRWRQKVAILKIYVHKKNHKQDGLFYQDYKNPWERTNFSLDPHQMPLVVGALNRSRFPLCIRRNHVWEAVQKPEVLLSECFRK